MSGTSWTDMPTGSAAEQDQRASLADLLGLFASPHTRLALSEDEGRSMAAALRAECARHGMDIPPYLVDWHAGEGDQTHTTWRRQADDPGLGDVHVPAPLGTQPGRVPGARPRTKSHMLTRLVQRLRGRFKEAPAISSEQFEEDVRHAFGHAGGMGTAEARTRVRAAGEAPLTADEDDTHAHTEANDDWQQCTACADGRRDDCACPGCVAGTTCWCHDADADREDDPGDHPGAETEAGDTGQTTRGRRYGEGASHVTAGGGQAFRLFLPLSFADTASVSLPTWIPYLPMPGTFKHPRYGDIHITRDRNTDFCQKFNAGVYQSQVPLDAEHETKLSGAMGWIKELRLNEDGSADARVEWTDRGRMLLADNRYKFVSPEWYDQWTDPATGHPISNVAIGGALTTRPYFKESALRPLVASETGIYVPDEDQHPVPPSRAGDDTETRPTGPEDTQMATETVQLTEEQIKRFAEMETDLRQAREQATQAAQEAKVASERAAALESENRRRAFAEQAESWHGVTSEHVSFMEGLTDEQRTFYVTQQNALAAQLRDSKLFSAAGVRGVESEGTALAKLRQVTAEIRKATPSLTEAKAMSEALARHPDLYAAYEDESR